MRIRHPDVLICVSVVYKRWIERPPKTPGYYGTGLSLILAESARVNGKPRQRHIAYLGGITALDIENIVYRCHFWDSVSAAFNKLGNEVPPADRKRFEAAIADRVPRPSSAEYKAAARKIAQRYGWSRLSKEFKAALANEADKWKAREVQIAREVSAELAEVMRKARK
jgi:hypothetical protein